MTQGRLYHGGALSVHSPRVALLVGDPLQVGEQVEQGQVLATLHDSALADHEKAIKAELDAARAALATQKATLEKVLAAPLPPDFLFSGTSSHF